MLFDDVTMIEAGTVQGETSISDLTKQVNDLSFDSITTTEKKDKVKLNIWNLQQIIN